MVFCFFFQFKWFHITQKFFVAVSLIIKNKKTYPNNRLVHTTLNTSWTFNRRIFYIFLTTSGAANSGVRSLSLPSMFIVPLCQFYRLSGRSRASKIYHSHSIKRLYHTPYLLVLDPYEQFLYDGEMLTHELIDTLN